MGLGTDGATELKIDNFVDVEELIESLLSLLSSLSLLPSPLSLSLFFFFSLRNFFPFFSYWAINCHPNTLQ